MELTRKDTDICPVAWLTDYLKLRGEAGGLLFLKVDGTPVTRDDVVDALHAACEFLGLSKAAYITPTVFEWANVRTWQRKGHQ